ncbi:hypothetical protein HPB47_015756 [Ixodes persulcatus]|uniref:Uncharacterized protein n=1 Tax=Ixodes persulcatus TaxID=34615 RepID=A0AC60QSS3_IXOPE|nr:hypothetical protein HPB47_015756 [Ixodes persulcatus]
MRVLPALALIPLGDLDAAFDSLMEIFPDEAMPLAQYFEDTYLGRRRGLRRISPMFALSLLNVNDAVHQHLPRTNNSAEAWHRGVLAVLRGPPLSTASVETQTSPEDLSSPQGSPSEPLKVTHTQSPSCSKGAVPSKEGTTPSKPPEAQADRTTSSSAQGPNASRRMKKWTRAYRSLKTTSLSLKQSLSSGLL